MKTKQMIEEFPRRLSYRFADQNGYDETGEVLDKRPLSVPFDCKKPESLEQMISRILAAKMQDPNDNEWETEDEANDLDVEDDDFYEPDSPYEELFDPLGNPRNEVANSAASDTESTKGGSSPKASVADSPDHSQQAPAATAKKRKSTKVTVEPELESEDDE